MTEIKPRLSGSADQSPVGFDAAAGPVRSGTNRDTTIDIIRGLAVASMIVSHSSMHSVLHSATHFMRWIDGAEGFVLLAGVVLGMVHRRSTSFRSSARRITRRAFVVYLAHVAIVLLAFVTLRPPTLPPPPEALGGWGPAILYTLSLQINPDQFAFLSMYVILFGETLVAVLLLRRGLVAVVAALSLILYCLALVYPAAFVLPSYPGGPWSEFNSGAWQLLWMSGLIFGWYWTQLDLRRLFLNRWLLGGSIVCLGFAFALARLVDHVSFQTNWWAAFSQFTDQIFDKWTLGPGNVVLSWCAFVVLYATIWRTCDSRFGSLMKFAFAGIGRRSLDSLIILSAMLEITPLFVPFRPESVTGMAVAILIFVTCWAWAKYRGSATISELLGWISLRRGRWRRRARTA